VDAPGLSGSPSAAGPDPSGAVATSVGYSAPHRTDRRPFCRAPARCACPTSPACWPVYRSCRN